MKCLICDNEVTLKERQLDQVCPICLADYTREGILNIREDAIPVYRQAYRENWTTKQLIQKLKELP